MPATVEFLGVKFDAVDQGATLDAIRWLSHGNSFSYIVTPNVDHIVRLHEGGGVTMLQDAYAKADLRVCDSRILQTLAHRSGRDLPLVTGSDLTAQLVKDMSRKGGRLAVVGGDALLVSQLRSRYAAIEWEHHEPPMGVRDDPEARERIASFVEECQASIVLFCIGFPQSEITCAEIKAGGRAAGVGLCVGASLEFLVGRKRRAPWAMQAANLEWLFRLASEPKRLWRRYLIEGPRIFAIWLNWRRSIPPRDGSGSNPSDAS